MILLQEGEINGTNKASKANLVCSFGEKIDSLVQACDDRAF